jgi:hypothetical protein
MEVTSATGRETRVLFVAIVTDSAIPYLLTFVIESEQLEIIPNIRGRRTGHGTIVVLIALIFTSTSFWTIKVDWIPCSISTTSSTPEQLF